MLEPPDAGGQQRPQTAADKPDSKQTEAKSRARRKLLLSALVGITGLAAFVNYWPKRWKYIVIHHSAGDFATIEFLQEVHAQRQSGDPIDAIPYHYVVGNGQGIGDGVVEQDWRGRWHIWGAHVSARNPARNYYGIGICLVGNFEQHPPTSKQYDSVVNLCRSLMRRYNIPVENVSGHGLTAGERSLCPGKYFPIERFLNDLEPVNTN